MPVSFVKTLEELPQLQLPDLPLCERHLLGLVVKGKNDGSEADIAENIAKEAFRGTGLQLTMLRILSGDKLAEAMDATEPVSIISIAANIGLAAPITVDTARGRIISAARRAFPKQEPAQV